jgi:hypothetical protein
MTSPLRRVLTFGGDFNLAQLRPALADKEPWRVEQMRPFVVNALVVGLIISQSPGPDQLLYDLRYHLGIEPAPDLGKLPPPIFTSGLSF